MIHSACVTYGGGWPRCEDCGKYWCERCRAWFGGTASRPVPAGFGIGGGETTEETDG